MRPSFEELTYFFEISKSLNLSRASSKLGISQPTLSLAIKRLENTVGAALFVRHKQGVTLTRSGKQLLVRVKQLLEFWDDTRSLALASQQEIKGRFSVGCHSAIAMRICSFLPDLLEKHPKLEIQFSHELSHKITESIINFSIDIGIVTKPIKHPDLIIRKLYDNRVSLWVGPGSRRIQNIHSGQATIICDPDLIQSQLILKKLKAQRITIRRLLTSNNLEVIANLAAEGAGIGILPNCIVKRNSPDKLKEIPKMPVSSEEICMIYRNENRSIKAIRTITASIKKTFEPNG